MALQWMILSYIVAAEAVIALILTVPLPKLVKSRVVSLVSVLLQPAISIVPFAAFQIMDIYWKNEHRLMCTGEACTASERDRYEKTVKSPISVYEEVELNIFGNHYTILVCEDRQSSWMGEGGMEMNFHNSPVAGGARRLPVVGAKAVVQVAGANSTRVDIRGVEERESSHPRVKGPSLATEPTSFHCLGKEIMQDMKISNGAQKGNETFGLEEHCGEHEGSLFETSLPDKMARTAHKLKEVTGTDVAFTNEVEKRSDTTFKKKAEKKEKFEMAGMDIRPSSDETASKTNRCHVGDLTEIAFLLATCAERLLRREDKNEHPTSSKSQRHVELLEDQSSNKDLEPCIKDSLAHCTGGSLLGKSKENMESPFSGSIVGESSSGPPGFKFRAARPISNQVMGPSLVIPNSLQSHTQFSTDLQSSKECNSLHCCLSSLLVCLSHLQVLQGYSGFGRN